MTPLERAARDVASVKMWDGDTIGQNLTTEEIASAVRAVLLAIREPSEGMVDASWHITGESKEMRPRTHTHYGRHWTAMIDKALEEG